MTTAYTSLLGLALPVQGELSGQWGDVVNNSITSLLDSAVAGTTNVSTDGDVTLTTTTGAANQAREAILLFSGSRTALRTITAPAQSKVYTVINATTGGYSVKLVGAGPTTGVTIVAGESAVCAWNGSDFVKVSNTGGTASFVDLTISGNLTLSGGTANGVLYLNGSKVATSGSALTFDGTNFGVGTASPSRFVDFEKNQNAGTLTRIGNTTSGTGAYSALQLSSSAATYLYNFSNAYTTSGKFAAGSTLLDAGGTGGLGINAESVGIIFYTGSTEQMRLNSTGLGIGTSSPSYKLDVQGVSTTTLTAASITNTSSAANTTKSVQFNFRLADTAAFIKDVAYITAYPDGTNAVSGGLTFSTRSADTTPAERMRLDSSGNLGLGVTPSAWYSNYKALQINSTLSLASAGGTGGFEFITSNAYIGAGDVFKYINSSVPAVAYRMNNAVGDHRWYTAPTGTAGNAITFTQAMTLDASGRLQIGTTNSASATIRGLGASNANAYYYLDANGPFGGSPSYSSILGFALYTDSGTRYNSQAEIACVADSNYSGSLTFSTQNPGTYPNTVTERMRIASNGNVGVGTTPSYKLDVYRGSSGVVLNLEGVNAYDAETGIAMSSGRAKISGFLNSGGGTPGSSLRFYTMPDGGSVTEAARITSGGVVAINPNGGGSGNKLLVTGGGSGALGAIKIGDGDISASTNYWNIGRDNAVSGAFTFALNGSEAMRIDTSGNLLVGTTSSSRKLEVLGGGNGILTNFHSTRNTVGDFCIYAQLGGSNTNGTGSYYLMCDTDSVGQRMIVYGNGNIVNVNNSYGTLSDIKLKENIVDATPKLDDVMRLQVRNFNLKSDPDHKQIGFVAQELEQVFPAMVDTSPDYDKEGNDLGTTTKSIKSSVLIPILVKAIQEQQALIVSLKARLDAANL